MPEERLITNLSNNEAYELGGRTIFTRSLIGLEPGWRSKDYGWVFAAQSGYDPSVYFTRPDGFLTGGFGQNFRKDELGTFPEKPDTATLEGDYYDELIYFVVPGGTSSALYEYDPFDDQFTDLGDVPSTGSNEEIRAVTTDDNGNVWIIGGPTNSNEVRRYDIDADSFSTSFTAPPSSVESPGADYYDGDIYIPWPANGQDPNQPANNEMLIYDVGADSWSSVSGPTDGFGDAENRQKASVTRDGSGDIWCMTGEFQAGGTENTTYIWDVAGASWSGGPDVPNPGVGSASVDVDGDVWYVPSYNVTDTGAAATRSSGIWSIRNTEDNNGENPAYLAAVFRPPSGERGAP